MWENQGTTEHISPSDDFVLTAYDWGESGFTDKQKAFVFYFTWPGQEGFHCAYQAAKRAGYADSVAKNSYTLLCEPKIREAIQRFESQAKASVHDAAARFVQEKIIRANFDVADFYETLTWTDENTGKKYRKLVIKDLDKLTPEQRLCIDGIDSKNGVSVLVFADRQKERDSIIALDRVWNGAANGDRQDVDEIKEVIIERVTVRQAQRIKQATDNVQNIGFEVCEASDADGATSMEEL